MHGDPLLTRSCLLSIALALAGLITACSDPSPKRTLLDAESDTSQVSDRRVREHRFDQVRDVFELHCGSCHLPHGEYAFALPLSVYDLTMPTPLALLSDAQLAEAFRRFDEQNVGSDERKRLLRFFRETYRDRHAHPHTFSAAMRQTPAADPVVTPANGCLGETCFDHFRDAFAVVGP